MIIILDDLDFHLTRSYEDNGDEGTAHEAQPPLEHEAGGDGEQQSEHGVEDGAQPAARGPLHRARVRAQPRQQRAHAVLRLVEPKYFLLSILLFSTARSVHPQSWRSMAVKASLRMRWVRCSPATVNIVIWNRRFYLYLVLSRLPLVLGGEAGHQTITCRNTATAAVTPAATNREQ